MNPQSITIISTVYAMSTDIATNYPPSQYTQIFGSIARSMAKIAKLEGIEGEVMFQATSMTALKEAMLAQVTNTPTMDALRVLYPDASQEELETIMEKLLENKAKEGGDGQ